MADGRYNGRYEINTLPSETVPDQSMSVHELLRRHQAGTLTDIQNYEVLYTDDLPDLRGLDIIEKRQWIQDNEDYMVEMRESFARAKAQADADRQRQQNTIVIDPKVEE